MWVTQEALQWHFCCVEPGVGPGRPQIGEPASIPSICGTALGIHSPLSEIDLNIVSESTVFQRRMERSLV